MENQTSVDEFDDSNFDVQELYSVQNLKYNALEVRYQVNVQNITSDDVNSVFNKMIEMLKQRSNLRNGDKIRLAVLNDNLNHPISTALVTYANNYNPASTLATHLENILTSDEEVDINDCEFHITVLNIPQGQGRGKVINLAEDKRTKKSIIEIKNSDNLCLPRAIVTALTYHGKIIFQQLGLMESSLTENEIAYIRKGRCLQKQLALELMRRCDLPIPEPGIGMTLEDIKQIESQLDIQITVVCVQNFNSVIYSGSDRNVKLYLYKNMNHFDVICSMTGFYGSSYYCERCHKTYDHNDGHTCPKQSNIYKCNVCNGRKHSDDIIDKPKWIECTKCQRWFFNQECFTNHVENKTCDAIWKCNSCRKILMWEQTNPTTHKCGERKCKNCNEMVLQNHKCHMQNKQSKGGYCMREIPCWLENNKRDMCYACKTRCEKYFYFDFECEQESGIHEPNHCRVMDHRGLIDLEFWANKETNAAQLFCKWLISKEHKGYTAIAHNAKGYDSYFIMKYCVENALKPYTIYNGSKLMLLEIECLKLKIIDSMNFVAGPLSAFPKTFGLTELKKGYFPHYFNTKENRNYIGPIPDKKYFNSEKMMNSEREQFIKWHAEKEMANYVWDNKKELRDYCRSDVDILRRGCIKFREDFLEIANIDPFQYLTIPSVCMALYRDKYLKPKTIAINKFPTDTYSNESILWMDYIIKTEGINIQHAVNGGEVKINGANVDGFCPDTNTVYQFHGCFYHGCPKCFKPETINNKTQNEMKELFEKTQKRTNELKINYNVVELWECDFKRNRNLKEFKKSWNREVVTPLNPREAFYGGRTNASKLLYKCKNNQKIRYIDVCSLYPTVQFYDYYPVGHPIKICKPQTYDPEWYGIIKCKVIPPRKLYHPVLPVKIKMEKSEKLLFPLCLTCARKEIKECAHSDSERAINGTWTTDELNKSISKGYRIDEIHEVWHFESKSNSLFKDYVKDFMKIKLETSPWTDDFKNVNDYIEAVKEKLNIDLDKNKIQINPGRRNVAKVCLCSFWGKFGQRTNLSKTEYVTNVKRFYEIVLDDKLDNINMEFLNEEMVQINYCQKGVFIDEDYNTNIFVAAFTTSNARLRLYQMLEKLGDSVVYYDTDSIIYIDDGTNTVETGCMLGEWTNELGQKHITCFSSNGPKSYGYVLNDGKEICKIKGFRLHHKNSKALNFESISKLVKNEIETVKIIENNVITRNTKTKEIVNKTLAKVFQFEYNKRVVKKINNDHIDTLPYGW